MTKRLWRLELTIDRANTTRKPVRVNELKLKLQIYHTGGPLSSQSAHYSGLMREKTLPRKTQETFIPKSETEVMEIADSLDNSYSSLAKKATINIVKDIQGGKEVEQIISGSLIS